MKFLLVLLSIFFSGIQISLASFSDIANHPYQDSIEYIAGKGVVSGYPDGTYKPDNFITRAEVLTIIVRAIKDTNILTGKNCFSDVSDYHWFSPYVCYAKENKIVSGYGDGSFGPQKLSTIAESLAMGFKRFGHEDSIDALVKANPYTIRRRSDSFLNFAHVNNIFSRYSIHADGEMTRGQMAYFIHKLLLEREGNIQFDGIRDNRSAGCFKSPPTNIPRQTIVDSVVRNYISVIGKNYNHQEATKLIIAFHGRTNSNDMIRGYYGIEQASDGKSIFVYPSGLPEESLPRNWSDGNDTWKNIRDYELFDMIVKDFTDNYCIDQDEIYVVGHSLGGWIANNIACARGDIVRGVASVGGDILGHKKCAGPVASMIMHNPNDNLAPFVGGEKARNIFVSQNSCTYETSSVGPVDGKCVKYTNCQEDAPVIWCPHSDDISSAGAYYPHTRPDFAGKYIRDFFNNL